MECSAVRSHASPATGRSCFPDTDTSSSATSWPSPGAQVVILTGDFFLTQITFNFCIIFLPWTVRCLTWQLSHTMVKSWLNFSVVEGKKATCKYTASVFQDNQNYVTLLKISIVHVRKFFQTLSPGADISQYIPKNSKSKKRQFNFARNSPQPRPFLQAEARRVTG